VLLANLRGWQLLKFAALTLHKLGNVELAVNCVNCFFIFLYSDKPTITFSSKIFRAEKLLASKSDRN
jgi:hypothetical protein